MPRLDAVPRRVLAAAFLLLALIVVTVSAGVRKFPLPADDAVHYLSYARTLYMTGQFAATPAGPSADASPGREPLYSVVVAGVARIVPGLGRTLEGCWPLREDCKGGLRALAFVNAALLAIAAVVVLATVLELGGAPVAALIAGGYLALNLQMQAALVHTYSDFLAVALVAVVSLAMARAMKQPGSVARWLLLGIAVGLLVLTKHIFLPYAVLLLAVLGASALVRVRTAGWRAVVPAVMVAAMLAALVGGWALRNIAHFGAATDSRGAVALSTREVFDEMGVRENLAAIVMWTRGPGNRLARLWFPEEVTRLFNQKLPEGYYVRGQLTNSERRLARIEAEQGVTRAVAHTKAMRVVAGEIAARWPGYLLSMPALFWRGLWFDEFIVIGLPLLGMALWRAARDRHWVLLAALSPGLFSLLAYPAVSLNIPRYQFTAVATLAIATGLMAAALLERWRARDRDRG